jgi:hypothetical protein
LLSATALAVVPTGVAGGSDPTGKDQQTSPIVVKSYNLRETPAAPIADPAASSASKSTLLWGYEAAFDNARILTYNIAPFSLGPACVPTPSVNGRGLAFDPLDGNLWYTFVGPPTLNFEGDGLIHKTTPPNVTPGSCPQRYAIPFADGPGGVVQDDIGALDVDEATKHLWVAGYKPLSVAGGPLRSYLYFVNRNTGTIIHYCWVPFGGGGEGNDTLTVYKGSDSATASKYLLTDAGEDLTENNANSLLMVGQSSCHSGAEAQVVATISKVDGVTGADFEYPGLIYTNLFNLSNRGGPPFGPATPIGATATVLEDISLCGFRATFAGSSSDLCPY